MTTMRWQDQPGEASRGKPGWRAGQRRSRRRSDVGQDSPETHRSGFEAPPRRSDRTYPWEADPDYRQSDHRSSRRLPPLPKDHPARDSAEQSSPRDSHPEDLPDDAAGHAETDQDELAADSESSRTKARRKSAPPPEKLTVTRVAAWRSRDLTQRAMRLFFSAAHADGADRSGLARFTYTVMGNYAVDAAMAIALANTLFFSAATGESRGKVALYLLITVAPFAVIAPVIGPLLDRLQQGRRLALAGSFAIRVVLAVVMALNFNNWLLYPAALGCMVLSKSFNVLKAAMTPRVLPSEITLTKANSRLTTFGLAAGGVFGAVGSAFAGLFGSEGALWYMAVLAGIAAWMCLRIPSWVESTQGEVPVAVTRRNPNGQGRAKRAAMTTHVTVALWGNGSIRLLTGFLTLFAAFVIKETTQQDPFTQLLLLGTVGAAAGAGSFIGNAAGAQMHFGKPDRLIIACLSAAFAVAVLAALLSGFALAAIVGLVGSTASALAKVCLDAVVQRDMPEESRASTFGRSETVLQLGWVSGGALGVLLPPVYWIGFTVVAVLLGLGLARTATIGRTNIPRGRGRPLTDREQSRS